MGLAPSRDALSRVMSTSADGFGKKTDPLCASSMILLVLLVRAIPTHWAHAGAPLCCFSGLWDHASNECFQLCLGQFQMSALKAAFMKLPETGFR